MRCHCDPLGADAYGLPQADCNLYPLTLNPASRITTIIIVYAVDGVLRSFYLEHVLPVVGDVKELFEKVITVFSIRLCYLQENGIISVEHKCGRTEYLQIIHGMKVVFDKPFENRGIIEIIQEPVHIYSGFFRDVIQDGWIRDIKMVPMKGI